MGLFVYVDNSNVWIEGKKEQVRASLRRHIRRLLTKYQYPPDKEEAAVLLVMQQAELLASEVAV